MREEPKAAQDSRLEEIREAWAEEPPICGWDNWNVISTQVWRGFAVQAHRVVNELLTKLDEARERLETWAAFAKQHRGVVEGLEAQLQAAQGRVSEIVREKATLYDQFEGDFRKLQAENATLRQRVEELEAMLNATE
ncbi:MAG: hypothetical protein QNJ62_06725 [Methyloceanibacter sp.]|nr:hypothetical protein [Methyloceanibacter sp.]